MDKSKTTRAQQVAQAAIDRYMQKTGRLPKAVAVAFRGVRFAIAPHGVLCSSQSASMQS